MGVENYTEIFSRAEFHKKVHKLQDRIFRVTKFISVKI